MEAMTTLGFIQRHPQLSFNDGNLVLCPRTGPHYFLVHRGLLGHHSNFFSGSPGTTDGSAIIEDQHCQIVFLQDPPNDLLAFLKALYDGM